MQATRTAHPATLPGDATQQVEFSQALATLDQLLETPQLRALLAAQECVNAAQVYTTLPTIWLLITQRLGGGLTLSQAVSQLLRHHRNLLPNNKRVREKTLSENNSMMKEMLSSVIAFNLVMSFRQQAAQRAQVEPCCLSFSGVWTSFQDHLLRRSLNTYEKWVAAASPAAPRGCPTPGVRRPPNSKNRSAKSPSPPGQSPSRKNKVGAIGR